MSQAVEHSPEAMSELTSGRSIIRAAIESSLTIPVTLTHSDLYPIFADKRTSKNQKITSLVTLTFETYGRLTEAAQSALPSDDEVEELVNFALYLRLRAFQDTEVEVELEMLDEAVSSIESISPIALAKRIEKLESQYGEIPETNTLVMKLWTFERDCDPDSMPTHFDKARIYCKDHPVKPGQAKSMGNSFLS